MKTEIWCVNRQEEGTIVEIKLGGNGTIGHDLTITRGSKILFEEILTDVDVANLADLFLEYATEHIEEEEEADA